MRIDRRDNLRSLLELMRSPPPLGPHLLKAHSMGLALIVLLAAALRVWGIEGQSFWYDEYLTRTHVSQGFGDMLESIAETEGTPPPYYVIAWLWAKAFGTGEVGLRSLSALLGIATVPVVYAGVCQIASKRAALVAASLVATSPFLVWYSQEARSYALAVLLAAVSFAFFARAVRHPSREVLMGWAAASAFAVATHYLAGLLVASEAALLLILLWERRRQVVVATGAVALLVLALIPLASSSGSPPAQWIRDLPFDERLIQVPLLFGVGNSYPAEPAVIAVALLGAVVPSLLLIRADADERNAAGLAFAAFAGGTALALLAPALGVDYIVARYLLPLWVPLAATVAIGLGSRRAGLLGAGATVALCGLWTAMAIEVKRDDSVQRIDWRAAAELIRERNERLIVVPARPPDRPHVQALLSYLEGVQVQDSATTNRVAEVVVLSYEGSPRGRLCYWGAACWLSSPTEPDVQLPGQFRLIERDSQGRFTASRYRSPRQVEISLPFTDDTAILLQAGF